MLNKNDKNFVNIFECDHEAGLLCAVCDALDVDYCHLAAEAYDVPCGHEQGLAYDTHTLEVTCTLCHPVSDNVSSEGLIMI